MAFDQTGISCSTCKLAPKEDGGAGGCTRTVWYPILRERESHDCPLWKRRPQKREPSAPPQSEGLF